jgi:phosphoribosylglycinamide formyltransferase-1
MKLGFLASHGGSSMRAIYAAIQAGQLPAQVQVVISNNSQSDALAFARTAAIPAYHLSVKTEQTAERLDSRMRDLLIAHEVQFVILSGYMKKLGPQTLTAYKDRILNIHPALLPKYGGQGMYGAHVYAAVLAAGEQETGITIHLIDERYDQGRILAQCRMPIFPADTPESLALRVQAREGTFFVDVLRQLAEQDLPQSL